MPQAAPMLMAVSGVAAVAGTVMSYNQQKKAGELAQQQQEVNYRRERMQAIRQAQIQRAQAIMSSVGAGSSESSGAAGGIGSISSQLGTQMGFGSQMSELTQGINQANQSASMWGGVANLGMTGFNMFGGGDWLKSKVGGSTPSPTPVFSGLRVPRANPNF